MSIVNRALAYFIDFDYQNEMVKQIYRKGLSAIKIIFDNENASSGSAYLVRREDYRQMNFLTFELNDEFYNFYLYNQYNPNLRDIDLRVYYYLNRQEEVKYKCKLAGRNTKILFSKVNICCAYDYPDRERQNIRVACVNDAFTQIDGKYYCLSHVPN